MSCPLRFRLAGFVLAFVAMTAFAQDYPAKPIRFVITGGAGGSTDVVARIVGEFFREPDPQLGFLWGGLTMGMLLSVPLMLIGIWLIQWASKRPPLRQG